MRQPFAFALNPRNSMSALNLDIGLSLALSGALLIAVCLPLLKDRIKPNALYGIRLPKSFESDDNWFKMNRYGAKQMILWAGVMMALGALSFFLPLQGNAILATIVAVAPVLLLLIPVFQIFRYSKTL